MKQILVSADEKHVFTLGDHYNIQQFALGDLRLVKNIGVPGKENITNMLFIDR